MKRPGLGAQLGFAFAAVAAFTALLAGIIVALSWQGTFDAYVRGRVQSDANLLAEAAARSWAVTGSWRRDGLVDIGVFSASRGLRVQVLDTESEVILDSADLGVSVQMPGGFTMPGMSGTVRQTSASPLRDPIVQVPIYVDNSLVGSLKVASVAPGTFLTDRDVSFRTSSSTGLAVAALLAVALASAGGVLYSRRLLFAPARVTLAPG
jgi:hypothetical protein